MDAMWWVVVGAVIVALAFDVINGFHDAANSIATVVSTRVLSPRLAVLWAAFFNFVAMFVFPAKVADTVSKIVQHQPQRPRLRLRGAGRPRRRHRLGPAHLVVGPAHQLVARARSAGSPAPAWPTPAGRCCTGRRSSRRWSSSRWRRSSGWGSAVVFMLAVYWVFRRWRPAAVDALFRRGQLLSAALYSLGHGGNDAQKTMGIIVALLVAAGHMAPGTQLTLGNPSTLWIILACHAAMALGTAARRLAHRQDDGHAASPSSSPSAASAPRPPAPRRSSSPPTAASRSRPRTPSPAPSSASARRGSCRR